jgi:hypothetical protein
MLKEEKIQIHTKYLNIFGYNMYIKNLKDLY